MGACDPENATGWLTIGSRLAVAAYLARRRPTCTLDRTSHAGALPPPGPECPAGARMVGTGRPGGGRGPHRRQPASRSRPSGISPSWRRTCAGIRDPRGAPRSGRGVAPLVGGSDPSRFLRDAPFGLTRALATLPAGTRTLVYQPWGSWFEFAVPNDPVFVDSRIEVPSTSVWDDYRRVASGDGDSPTILDRWRVDAIAAPGDWRSLPLLEAPGSGWQVVYQDQDGVLLTRS